MAFTPTGDEPKTIKEFLAHYALVVRFILGMGSNKISVTDNIQHNLLVTSITHGKSNIIGHTLGVIPKSITCSGRVEFLQINQKTKTDFTCTPKLLGASIVNPLPNISTSRIMVEDVTFFRTGDILNIGGVRRKLVGIDSNTLLLDQPVIYSKIVYTISLADEPVEIFLI